ncbi:MAG: alpha/beta hydrolase [Pelobacteraceae bacterium]
MRRFDFSGECARFDKSEMMICRNIVYSVRHNNAGIQYTSDRTKAAEAGTDELILKLDVIVPPGTATEKPHPLVVWFHGGAFAGGDKEDAVELLLSYARAGFVTAAVNYRLTPDNHLSPALRLRAIVQASEDAMNAIRFLKVNAASYHIDPTRIATIGASAGGGLSLLNAVAYDRLPGTQSDFSGVSSQVAAAVSTGATLFEEGKNSDDVLTYQATDTPVLLFHANPTDSTTGATWDGNVVPTRTRINDSGNRCITVAQPDMTHTVDLSLGGPYWQELKPFLWELLRLGELEKL